MSYTNGLDKPTDYFETKLYTGNGGTQSITGLDFAPSWVWLKNRNTTANHHLYDVIRGATKQLTTVDGRQEATQTNALTSLNSDGFTVGIDGDVNGSGNGIVSWNWLAGTSVSGTTTGSGTSKAYTGSVNTDAGFSIISFTGNETSGHTVPHHLGVAPSMVIVKRYDASNNWRVGHNGLTSWEYRLTLESTDAQGSQSAVFNSTAPTSSVVTFGNSGSSNGNNANYIMYSFAEKKGFSKFGSYVGNGSSSGPMIYLGFKPAFYMIKRTDSSGAWIIKDNLRPGYNVNGSYLVANDNIAEATGSGNVASDELSNGFKIRGTSSALNTSGGTYIYYAVAESPFTTSTGIPTTAR